MAGISSTTVDGAPLSPPPAAEGHGGGGAADDEDGDDINTLST